jgi:hypothetical protein
MPMTANKMGHLKRASILIVWCVFGNRHTVRAQLERSFGATEKTRDRAAHGALV